MFLRQTIQRRIAFLLPYWMVVNPWIVDLMSMDVSPDLSSSPAPDGVAMILSILGLIYLCLDGVFFCAASIDDPLVFFLGGMALDSALLPQ